jgi:hypothetical protein
MMRKLETAGFFVHLCRFRADAAPGRATFPETPDEAQKKPASAGVAGLCA